MPTSGHALEPPNAPSRIARMPHDGASVHAIQLTQPGSSDSGTSNPVTSQTGYSSRFENALAWR